MFNYLVFLYHTIASPHFLITVTLISVIVKSSYLHLLISKGFNKKPTQRALIFLVGIIVGALVGDVAWVVKLAREIFAPQTSYAYVTFFIRMAWAFLVIQYLCLGLFVQSLATRHFSIHPLYKIIVSVMSPPFFIYFISIAFISSQSLITEIDRELAKIPGNPSVPLEVNMMRYMVLYVLPLLIIPALLLTGLKIRKNNLPKILKKQLRTFLTYLIIPYVISELILGCSFSFKIIHVNLYPLVSVSTILITYSIYYCMQRVLGLRFLNIVPHVQEHTRMNIIDDFKTVLEQLSTTISLNELGHITQTFFKDVFDIPMRNTTLCIPNKNHQASSAHTPPAMEQTITIIDHFVTRFSTHSSHEDTQLPILIYDEVSFNSFYEHSSIDHEMLAFLDAIDADIFIPIYTQNNIVAYIIISKNTRPDTCYSDVERDEMLVFASYLGNIINLMQSKNVESVLRHEKELKEELYDLHQLSNQYKESIRSFLRHTKQKSIGIIFYKSRRFTFANQIAKQLIPIDPNSWQGHPLTRALKEIAHQVETYKSPYSKLVSDQYGTNLMLSGVPHLELHNVIITVTYPDISDVINRQLNQLQDPVMWEYLLYLETTQTGKAVSQFITGSTETIINFKISLLRASLSKKPVLLDVAEQDLNATAEIIHHASLRETLHVLKLEAPTKKLDTMIHLFGINPIFGINKREQPLFEKLDGMGTLFIKNVHLLDLESQNYLAEYLKYGFYRTYKSDQKNSSDVRVICSSNQNLQQRVQEGQFSKDLFDQLKKSVVCMPSLITLPEAEFEALVESIAESVLKTQTFKNLLYLSERDKFKLTQNRPASLQSLKVKIQHILMQKSKDNDIYQDESFDPAYKVADPELARAARLGKQALKDHKIMNMLWNRFKNQNKIAIFLGVNRSSVNRRCKKYGLIPQHEPKE